MSTQPNTPELDHATSLEEIRAERLENIVSVKDPPYLDSDDKDPCGKLWEVYVNEARRYDEGLLKSWKEDMDVILVFSGLYSAVLTAFVIESYQKLQEDPADVSATLLKQISDQLVSLSANRTVSQSTSQAFLPSKSALACNVLWFLSLILALMCAFLATFVQQWTRQFLHRSSIARSPTAQARLLSFLYYGIRNYGMHAIVDVIPSFLHISLFAFLAGLVAFLHDVHPVLTWLVSGSLAVIAALYSAFTIWPIFTLNSPYQTPISPIVWRLWQMFRATALPSFLPIWTRATETAINACKAFTTAIHNISTRFSSMFNHPRISETSDLPVSSLRPGQRKERLMNRHSHTLVAAMKMASQENYRDREVASILWTISMLNDDAELLPFIEALPDVICPGNRSPIREQEIHLLRPMLETSDPNIHIIARTFKIMQNAQNPWITDEYRSRCLAACLRLLWALAFTLIHRQGEFSLEKAGRSSWFHLNELDTHFPDQWLEPRDDYSSMRNAALALCKLNIYISVEASVKAGTDEGTIRRWFPPPPTLSNVVDSAREADLQTQLETYKCTELVTYLQFCVQDTPYQFEETVSAFSSIIGSPHFHHAAIIGDLCKKFQTVNSQDKARLSEMDRIFGSCLDYANSATAIGLSYIDYVCERVGLSGWQATSLIWTNNPRRIDVFSGLIIHSFPWGLPDRSAIALREALFSEAPSASWHGYYDRVNLERIMLSILDGFSSNLHGSISQHCLGAMICCRLIRYLWQDIRWGHNSVALDSRYATFLEYLGMPTLNSPSWLSAQVDENIIPSFVFMLLARLLSYPSLTTELVLEIRNAAALMLSELVRLGASLSNQQQQQPLEFEAIHELARSTRAWCEFFQTNPTQEVADVLMVIWRIWRDWYPQDEEILVPAIELLVESMNAIESIASKVDLQNIHATGRFNKGPILYDISELYYGLDLMARLSLFQGGLEMRCPMIMTKYPHFFLPLPDPDSEGL